MGQNIMLVQHKMQDPIVKEGVRAINSAREQRNLKGFISGGMAIHSYLPEEECRGTIDLDYNFLWGGQTPEFKELTAPMVEYLKSRGYDISFEKQGLTFEYTMQKGEDSLLLQHKRRSATNFEKNRKSLEREVANKRIITGKEISYPVISPEDLIAHKLNRIINFSKRYEIILPHDLVGRDLRGVADKAREEILQRGIDCPPNAIPRVRVLYDCYDIKSLATHAGLDGKYFEEVLGDWEENTGSSQEMHSLLNRLGVFTQ